MKKLRRHTSKGVEEVELWLDQLNFEEIGSVPPILLDDARFTEAFEGDLVIDEGRQFSSRFDWGVYIEGVLQGLPTRRLAEDSGLWTWMTLALFDQVCPVGPGGKRKLSDRARYIPSVSDFRTYYRHYLLGPWRIVRAHRDGPERARVLLMNPLFRPGELAEQISAHQDLVSSAAVLEATSELYVDQAGGRLKRGAGGSGPGSPRRLTAVLDQLVLTFDFHEIGPEALLKLLPKEFKRFRTRSTTNGTGGGRSRA